MDDFTSNGGCLEGMAESHYTGKYLQLVSVSNLPLTILISLVARPDRANPRMSFTKDRILPFFHDKGQVNGHAHDQ